MLKRLMMIALLGISLVVILAAEANAQFDGWGWGGFSSIRGEIHTINTPNPEGQPSQIAVTVTATIQIACFNPASNGVFNGVAFHKPLTDSAVPGEGGTIDTKGDATTKVFLPLDQFEVKANCPNKNWEPIVGSAMALDFSGTVTWCLIDTKTGQLDCSPKKGFLDSSPVTCTLDTTDPLNQRNSNGTAPHTAAFDCPPPQ